MGLDLSFMKDPKVAIPVVVVGLGAGYLIMKRTGGSSTEAAPATGGQSPVEDPLAMGGISPTGGGTASGPPMGSPASPDTGVDQMPGGVEDHSPMPANTVGFVRSTPAPPPAAAITAQTRTIVGAVPFTNARVGDLVTENPDGARLYGAGGYFGNGNTGGYSDSAIEEGGNTIIAIGAPQANAAIPVTDGAGNTRTILAEALSPSPGVVNAGQSSVAPGSTASAQLENMRKNATPRQLASPEFRATWNKINEEEGGSARL